MFKRNLRIVLHILSRRKDVLSNHLLLSFKTRPSYVCAVVQYLISAECVGNVGWSVICVLTFSPWYPVSSLYFSAST
jgi:hypothetical protein